MIVIADVYHVTDRSNADIYSEPCYGDHTYERVDSMGRWVTVNGPCTCAVVQVGIVNGRKRFAVHTSSSELLDLPF